MVFYVAVNAPAPASISAISQLGAWEARFLLVLLGCESHHAAAQDRSGECLPELFSVRNGASF